MYKLKSIDVETRMNEEQIVEEFEHLHKSAARSKTARLRDLYDQIEALKSRGFSHATIIKAMKKHGLEFDLKTFEVLLYRIKRERTRLVQPSGTRELADAHATRPQTQISKDEESKSNSSMTTTSQVQSSLGKNPLHALSATSRKGDFNHIPKATFEVDEN